MANTTIQLKRSGTTSNAPVALDFGELALNYADGKLFYKHANGTILPFASGGGNAFGTVNANNTLVVADVAADVLTLTPGNNITIVGDAVNDKITIGLADTITTTGDVRASALAATQSNGMEGGQIDLSTAQGANTSLLGGNVSIDIYGDKLRFFEAGGTNRGAFIDISLASTGVGTDLLASSGTTDTVARAAASAAFGAANAAFANGNSAYSTIQSVFGATNAAFVAANSAFANGNSAYATLQIAFNTANLAFNTANTGGGGGGTSITTQIVSDTTQAAVKDRRYVLANVSSTTVTLPATPTLGDTLYILVANDLANNVVARNGSKIMGLDEDLTIDVINMSLGLVYTNATLGWRLI